MWGRQGETTKERELFTLRRVTALVNIFHGRRETEGGNGRTVPVVAKRFYPSPVTYYLKMTLGTKNRQTKSQESTLVRDDCLYPYRGSFELSLSSWENGQKSWKLSENREKFSQDIPFESSP